MTQIVKSENKRISQKNSTDRWFQKEELLRKLDVERRQFSNRPIILKLAHEIFYKNKHIWQKY